MRLPELRLALMASTSFSARSTAVSKRLVFSALRTYLLSSANPHAKVPVPAALLGSDDWAAFPP